ncbi:hypothetical protein LzC2_03010 [Planctomycetes bacterium LzC2]|uniref:Microbial-type PARG catalytic domain-containing protein n=2 Tax=Alienimonas chondri TaxID=2681879 RepID=A0ABX1V7R0_9PLAN|nr:hypothetical protein [Alienimonas chondri]
MSNRAARKAVAADTLQLLEDGFYFDPMENEVSIRAWLAEAVAGTTLICDPPGPPSSPGSYDTTIEVRNETTLAACRRLTHDNPDADVLALNFASAKNPGGGFLSGAQAQEESLGRATGLYACVKDLDGFYQHNRRDGGAFYSHRMAYSPGVPVFRDDADELLAEPYRASIFTAPAPNAGAVAQNHPTRLPELPAVFRERAGRVLAVAAHRRHVDLVLGAWGCGVFRNDPVFVANLWKELLDGPFRGTFRTVAMAVLDRPDGATINAFEQTFVGG